MRKCFVKSDVDRCSMMSSEKLMPENHATESPEQLQKYLECFK